jgi:hypothetical protein
MWWSKIAAAWQRWFPAPVSELDESIDEELMFHLRSLIDENLAKGMPADAAWHQAQTRFGSLRRYADECGRIFQRSRFTTQKFCAVGLLMLIGFVGWMAIEVRALRQAELLVYANAQRQAANAQQQAERGDLEGVVVDRRGRPLSDAKVLVVLKTWPEGWYRQEDFATTSDSEGRFRLAKLLPTDGHREVLVAAVKDGHALTSTYQTKCSGEPPTTEPIVLKLEDAVDLTVFVHDRAGRPVAQAAVVPEFRRTSGGQEHLVYLQASEPIQAVSNPDGRVGLGCLQRGDEAVMWIKVPGGDWERRDITISNDSDVITLSSDELAQGTDGQRAKSQTTGNPPVDHREATRQRNDERQEDASPEDA